MPPPSALQVGSLATAPNKFLPTQTPRKIPFQKSLQPLRTSLHFSSTRNFSAPLKIWTQIHHNYASIKRRAAEQVSDVAEIEEEEDVDSLAQGPDDDVPKRGQQFAQFAGGPNWLSNQAFSTVPGVTKTNAGFSQGRVHKPRYLHVRRGDSGHAEVVRVQYNPKKVSYDDLLDVFWEFHDPTQKNRQGFHLGSQYRSGIYFYSPEQEKAARESLERQQKRLDKKIVTEILPAKKFYRVRSKFQKRIEVARKGDVKSFKEPIRDILGFP
ncbi:hypothetical protein KI387_031331 [Taxus chinensis]|uniref:peptide-methionine (S)-S-oxide reductase n=1 Tax=Taxus chinensis TaxID=29808 RepID=A0AA38FBC7_TAXCH|nr:hypothetical protein KI387_031331 [Taxus chinensis]